LQVDLRAQINDYRARVPRTLSPHGVPNLSLVERVRRDVPYWVIGVATLAVVFFTYLVFALILDRQSVNTRVALEADRQRILQLTPPGLPARDVRSPRERGDEARRGTRELPPAERRSRPARPESDI
jgi:type VI secretion system protein ImpK